MQMFVNYLRRTNEHWVNSQRCLTPIFSACFLSTKNQWNPKTLNQKLWFFFRKLAGVSEIAFRNCLVNALWSVNPQASAMSDTDILVETNCREAFSRRHFIMNFLVDNRKTRFIRRSSCTVDRDTCRARCSVFND